MIFKRCSAGPCRAGWLSKGQFAAGPLKGIVWFPCKSRHSPF